MLVLFQSSEMTLFKNKAYTPAHRGIYHWKTTYDPTDWEIQWMKDHQIDRLYIKLFDVDAGAKNNNPDWRMVPIATTVFKQKLPADMDVVPVIYITVDAIRALDAESWHWEDKQRYAELLVKRINDIMAEYYEGTIREVQLDCDWTPQTEEVYFMLVREVMFLLHRQGITLSGTIRLHQLHEMEEPTEDEWNIKHEIPFDRCLLMCYNTGRLQDPKTDNSILNFKDVKPYLGQYHLDSLPRTDVAYPVYGWGVEFSEDGQFQKIVNSHNLNDSKQESSVRIREEWGKPEEIRKTQQALPTLDPLHTTILYHLDSLNLSKYSYEDIEDFYSR